MFQTRNYDESHNLGPISMIAELFSKKYRVYEFNADENEGPETTHFSVLLPRYETCRLQAELNSPALLSFPEDRSCKVTDIVSEGWRMTNIEGPRDFILAVVAVVEALGATPASL